MKNGLQHIVGKRIATVVVAASDRSPRNQVFLIFPDGTRFELWGDHFSCCSGLDSVEGLERYVESGKGRIVQVYGVHAEVEGSNVPLTTGRERAQYQVAAPETLEGLMTRDLAAWSEAKTAIEKAQRG
jgi:hypothetical protein